MVGWGGDAVAAAGRLYAFPVGVDVFVHGFPWFQQLHGKGTSIAAVVVVVVVDYWGPARAAPRRVLLARASALSGSLVRSTSTCSSPPPKISLFAARVPGHLSHQCSKVWGPSWQVGHTSGTESSSKWL